MVKTHFESFSEKSLKVWDTLFTYKIDSKKKKKWKKENNFKKLTCSDGQGTSKQVSSNIWQWKHE